MDWLPLVLSIAFFLAAFGHTMLGLRRGRHRPSRGNLGLMVAGFAAQTLFLVERGETVGRCPLSSFGDVMVFLGWSTVLLYLVTGPAYRLSLLGTFTAPLVAVLQSVAFIAPLPSGKGGGEVDAWIEFHAAVSVISYGAFALAGVAGAMLLVQEHHLKHHSLGGLFYQLPPITDLAGAIRKLMGVGLLLLTAGLGVGFAAGQPGLKIGLGFLVWGLYGIVFLAAWQCRLGVRSTAICSIVAFTVSLGSLWAMNVAAHGN